MRHPEDIHHKIECTMRKIARMEYRGRGQSLECQRLREFLDALIELRDSNEYGEATATE